MFMCNDEAETFMIIAVWNKYVQLLNFTYIFLPIGHTFVWVSSECAIAGMYECYFDNNSNNRMEPIVVYLFMLCVLCVPTCGQACGHYRNTTLSNILQNCWWILWAVYVATHVQIEYKCEKTHETRRKKLQLEGVWLTSKGPNIGNMPWTHVVWTSSLIVISCSSKRLSSFCRLSICLCWAWPWSLDAANLAFSSLTWSWRLLSAAWTAAKVESANPGDRERPGEWRPGETLACIPNV